MKTYDETAWYYFKDSEPFTGYVGNYYVSYGRLVTGIYYSENGARYLRWNTPFYSVLGILLVLRNVLQGLGKKVVPLVSSVIELIGKIVFVILFIPTLKYFGVIICEPVIWCLMCIQLVISYYRDPYIRGKEEKK